MAVVKLADICQKIGSGATPRGGKEAYRAEGIALVRSQNVLDFSFSSDGLAYINDEQADKLRNVELQSGDVLLNITGDSVARACLMDDDYLPGRVNQHVAIIRVDESKAVNSYLLYYLQWRKSHLLQLASAGATRNALTKGMIEQLEIDLPSLDEQRKVVGILGSIQNKIKLNHEINDNLLEQMQALYKSWFVDYRPFGGVMPTSWTQTGIYSLANIIYGAPFASKQFNTEGNGRPIIRIRDLKDQQFATYTTEVHPKGYLLHPGDIVVGMDGEFRPYIWGNDEAWLNQRVCVFENKRPNGKAFLYFTIKPLLFAIEQTRVATTVIHIGKKDFDAFEIMLPDTELLDAFDVITTPMVEQIVSNSIENKRLAIMRDALLPKLMSGEINVSNIQL
jgi:type I restriction enzyme S subunit